MSKAAIYTASTSPVTINLTAAQPTATLPLGTTVRRFGRICCENILELSGNGILARDSGYYKVDVSAVLTPAAAGIYTVTLYQDGQPVQGAAQSVTAAAGATIGLNIPAIVRTRCECGASTLTLVVSTTATEPATIVVNNTGVTVEKI
ncbi:MAG: hypothetical protein ACI4W2_10655 [Eubacterium sp.]